MINFQEILFLEQDPYLPILATAHVLGTLLGVSKVTALNCEDIKQLQAIPKDSVVLLLEEQLKWLVDMRRKNFAGAVLVFSHYSYDELISKYCIFRIGGSKKNHQSCDLSWNLVNILSVLDNLQPLAKGTQNVVVKMIKDFDEFINNQLDIELLIQFSELRQGDLSQNLNNLEGTVKRLWQGHNHDFSRKDIIDLKGYGKRTIEHHYKILIEKIKENPENSQQSIELLREVLTEWVNLVKKFWEEHNQDK